MRDTALARPDAVAIAGTTHVLTYAALETGANSLAHRLRALGVGPGTRVGLCNEKAAVTTMGALAILKAGGAYVALDPSYPAARLGYVLDDAAVPVLLTTPSALAHLGPVGAEVIDLEQQLSEGRSDPPEDLTTLDDVAYVIYTSGSTGQPKGVEVSHASLLSLVDWHCRAFSVTAEARATVLASPAFDASVWEQWPYIAVGASLHIPDVATAAAPEALRDWLVTSEISHTFAPTPLAEALLKLPWPSEIALRTLLTGGDRLNRRPGPATPFDVVNNYGVTEATVVSTSGPIAPDGAGEGPPDIGRPIAGTHVYVLDEDGRPVATGVAGELYIGGKGVAIGYVGRPDLTAQRFLPDPWAPEPGARMYRTGDRVELMAGGSLRFLGRLDDQVQIRGQRVEPHEVAAALSTHPAVDGCAVVAQEPEPGDRRLVAYVVSSGGEVPGRHELRDHLSASLPSHMVPTAFIWVDALPLTRNGKLDRSALPIPEVVGADSDSAPPCTPLETAVTAMLEELLELEGVGRDDNFFELGGHSLMAAQLVARLQDRFDVELSLLAIFDNPTAAGIAVEIEQDRDRATTQAADIVLR